MAFSHGEAGAQVLDRYFPANVPAYQDWFASLDTLQIDKAYQPPGVHAASFLIRPSIAEAVGYDSNPNGNVAARGSPALVTSGAVSVDSDWSRNGINVAVSADDTRYVDDPRLSHTTWTAAAGGVVDYADSEIRAGYDHLNTVSLPTDFGAFGLATPIVNQLDDVRLSGTIGPGPLILVPALVLQRYRFFHSVRVE